MDDREVLQYRVATMHYRDGITMEAVARQLGMSRSTVSRLLKDARASGLVRVTVAEPVARDEDVQDLEERFGVRVLSVPVWPDVPDATRLEAVARTSARLLEEWLREADRPRVGLAWGVTVGAVVAALEPLNCQAQVIQLNGAVNPSTTGQPYAGAILASAARAWRGTVVQFPVPAFFDHATTKVAMWRESTVRAVLEAQDTADTAVFGVGSLGPGTRSHVYLGGYLGTTELATLLEAEVVGDVCTVMLRADGTYDGIPLNDRTSGITPDRLRTIPRRLCVASGSEKARAVVAALRAGLVTVLVADAALVRSIARLVAAQAPAG
ncbi:sugar-binding transcriptional regulator [Raineyella fluvialis]|uniref:MarR family transcriptional regulator n=1 Tax=Raineyella fluvialis TaxID=2662261 RepID=A0A5Q2F986_9ACTN|nr:sugar-binding domain-containing protein [Raineyella fluvialis]QGF23248.1 MarR family transcriptional regulator [Raineyella fluvialis]